MKLFDFEGVIKANYGELSPRDYYFITDLKAEVIRSLEYMDDGEDFWIVEAVKEALNGSGKISDYRASKDN